MNREGVSEREEGREEGKCEENEYDMTDMGRKRENRGVLGERYPGRQSGSGAVC
jgi:hypothetical protein